MDGTDERNEQNAEAANNAAPGTSNTTPAPTPETTDTAAQSDASGAKAETAPETGSAPEAVTEQNDTTTTEANPAAPTTETTAVAPATSVPPSGVTQVKLTGKFNRSIDAHVGRTLGTALSAAGLDATGIKFRDKADDRELSLRSLVTANMQIVATPNAAGG